MTKRIAWAAAAVLIAALLSACGDSTSTVTETTPATDDTSTTATDTTTTAEDTTTEETTTTADTGGEASQSDLAQQIAACVAENGGDPKIDTLGDRVTIGTAIGPNAEQTVFAVLTDGRNAENFVDKLLADGADPNAVFYSEEQPVVIYFPQGPPSTAVEDTVNYCVYEYSL